MEKTMRFFFWKNREEDLKKVKRYGAFLVMFYRTNLFLHEKRVKAMLKKILPFTLDLYPDLNVEKAKLIAGHHDDYEIIPELGDIMLQTKLLMNGEELLKLKEKEIFAIDQLASFYPQKKKGYNYKQLLLHAVAKDCIEAQIVSLVDKYDGYCEAIHEVLAGNIVFLEPIINYQAKTFNDLPRNFPLIEKVFEKNCHPFFHKPVVDLKDFFDYGKIGAKPHTKETIQRKTCIPQYEEWKKITLKKFGIEVLTRQLEFHE